jgi:hypothetical protein
LLFAKAFTASRLLKNLRNASRFGADRGRFALFGFAVLVGLRM